MEATFVVTSRTIARAFASASSSSRSRATATRRSRSRSASARIFLRSRSSSAVASALASRASASASSSELCSRSTSPAWRRTAARYSTTRCVLTTVSARIARWPKRSVAVVSPACRGSGEHVNSRDARHPFPKQSRSKRVSFESR